MDKCQDCRLTVMIASNDVDWNDDLHDNDDEKYQNNLSNAEVS